MKPRIDFSEKERGLLKVQPFRNSYRFIKAEISCVSRNRKLKVDHVLFSKIVYNSENARNVQWWLILHSVRDLIESAMNYISDFQRSQ